MQSVIDEFIKILKKKDSASCYVRKHQVYLKPYYGPSPKSAFDEVREICVSRVAVVHKFSVVLLTSETEHSLTNIRVVKSAVSKSDSEESLKKTLEYILNIEKNCLPFGDRYIPHYDPENPDTFYIIVDRWKGEQYVGDVNENYFTRQVDAKRVCQRLNDEHVKNEWKRINSLLAKTIDESVNFLHNIEVPCANLLNLTYSVNNNAIGRYGQCEYLGNHCYDITISRFILQYASESKLREIVCHELIHTCAGAMNHGPNFKKYAAICHANGVFVKTREPEMWDEMPNRALFKRPQHQFVCKRCGSERLEYRTGDFVKNYECYTCGYCGGRFKKVF